MGVTPSRTDRVLRPLHRWVWRDPARRARKLLTFARTEADGSRDLARAAERTADPLLRRLFLRHARDEQGHAELFAARGRAILAELGAAPARRELGWLAPGERGLDDLRVEDHDDASLLAFLHLSEKVAAGRFALYRDVLADRGTADVFARVLRDEEFHMTYTRTQLRRVAPPAGTRSLLRARAGRVWRAYLRLASRIAGALGTVILLAQYLVLLPVFALLARRAARREPAGFLPHDARSARSQY
jgi:hypothetical protein